MAAKKRKVIDVSGAWRGLASVALRDAIDTALPGALVPVDKVFEIFGFDDDVDIPYAVFDMLRSKHGIDVTAISMSQTHRGSMYRAHALVC